MIPFDEEAERRYQQGPGPPDPRKWEPDSWLDEPEGQTHEKPKENK